MTFFVDEYIDPAALETLDDLPAPRPFAERLFTVWGCPLMTRVPADHPYFENFHMRHRLRELALGQITAGHCNGRDYPIERVS